MNNNPGFNYSNLFLPVAKYGYDDFLAIRRNNLSTEGPVVQYANAFNTNGMIVIPVKNFDNQASQIAIYDQNLLGEGFDSSTFKLDQLQISPSFSLPILCDLDNVPADYVFHMFDLCRKAPYGDAVEHVGRVSSISSNTVILDDREKYLLQLLKNSIINNSQNIYLRIVNGNDLKSLTDSTLISNISVNNTTITLANSISATGDFLLAVFTFYNAPTYPQPADTPPSREGYGLSTEFYLASSRDGLYYPSLVDSLKFEINSDVPSMEIKLATKRFDKTTRIKLNNQLNLPNTYPVYSIPKNEQARIKITNVSGQTLFYGLTPIVQSGTNLSPNPIFGYKSGIHFGDDLQDLTKPSPLLVNSISIYIENNLTPIFSLHTPRFTSSSLESYINDLGRFDNSCAYAFFSNKRKISGIFKLTIVEDEWFKKEFLPGLNSNTEGSIEIDTGYINITFNKIVFNLSPDQTSISSEYSKQVEFKFVSEGYDSMFEINMSKTGGRI